MRRLLFLNGIKGFEAAARCDTFAAVSAAVDGLGIAMGIRPYIDDDLAAGRLATPFALSVPKGMRWYLVYRSIRTEQRDFAAFRRWIIRAGTESTMRGKPTGKVLRDEG